MALRALGRSGLAFPPIMLGCNPFGWTINEATTHRILDETVALGLNALDTADIYCRFIPGKQGGESETMIGRWLARRGRRDDVILATKVGLDMGEGAGLSPAWIFKAVDNSLRRLRTDYIDLYQAHRDDPTTDLADTLGAFARLMEQGKVRAIGASNYSAPRLRLALETSAKHGLPRFESLQPLYHLMDRKGFESALAPLCLAEGVGVIPYLALASGFLTGKYRTAADLTKSQRGSRIGQYMGPRGQAVLAALDAVAAARQTSVAQVALAWLMARPAVTAPIASVSRPEQLQDLVGAARLSLTLTEISQLDEASG